MRTERGGSSERSGSGAGRRLAPPGPKASQRPPAPEVSVLAPGRVVIEGVQPEIDAGRYPAKGTEGDAFVVAADLVADGHDLVAGALLYRFAGDDAWSEASLQALPNDRFEGSFELTRSGAWEYTIEAWIDEFATWRRGLAKKVDAEQDVDLDLQIGAELVAAAAARAKAQDRKVLTASGNRMMSPHLPLLERSGAALDDRLAVLMAAHPDRRRASRYERVLRVHATRARARFSTWYEMFPRSCGERGQHGTLRDLERRLPYVASMGFDVLYLPPIHPIGVTHRKGRNNALVIQDGDPGSPWAIGSAAGGHKSVHPELGTLADLQRLVRAAHAKGLELALDIAFQTSPDHPYVKEHPDWFRHRPDGSIQYAENPPKKYEDIYPFDFDSPDWKSLWEELCSVFLFWIEQGVRIFRVDNPHTKALRFWEWCLQRIYAEHPDVIFLAEAFTRPKLMYQLAKAGFTQSYTYFTWRTTRFELTEYLTELTQPPVAAFFQPNFWPNTPDILPEHLQHGGRPAFVARLVLAATLSSSYGIYGPAFELMQNVARPGSGEYIDNEKYQLKDWNLDDPASLRPLIERINRIRREHPALQHTANLHFHATDNEQFLCFSKQLGPSQILVVVNLDPKQRHSGWVDLDVDHLRIGDDEEYQVHDLISDARYRWRGRRNYVELDPWVMPAHVLRIERFVRREHDFDYFA